MAKPIIYKIGVFDATKNAVIKFSYSGSITNVQAAFYNSETGEQIGQLDAGQQTTMPEYVVAANTLSNSTVPYYVQIRVIDYGTVPAVVSAWSDKVLFYCKTAPTISIRGFSATGENSITSASYEFGISYNKGQYDEPIGSFVYEMYNFDRTLYGKSGTLYSEISTYTFNNFLNDTNYYIRAYGESKNGFLIDTGYVPFHVLYSTSAIHARLVADNVYKTGEIDVHTNIISIEGMCVDADGNEVTPTYIDGFNSTKAIVLTNGNFVVFENGYKETRNVSIPKEPYLAGGDFSCAIVFKMDDPFSGKIMELEETGESDNTLSVHIVTREIDGTNKTYAFIIDRDKTYMVTSNYLVNYVGASWLSLRIKRVNGYYSIYLRMAEVS